MSDHSKIEWTDATWNPTTGCTLQLHPDRLDQPLHWRKPRRIFVNILSDLFHEDVPDEFIDRVFRVMVQARNHTFQVLTKRPERMRDYMSEFRPDGDGWVTRHGARAMGDPQYGPLVPDDQWPIPNVWLGVSVEDQRTADERIPILLQTPAAVRFVSYEPALGPVDLSQWFQFYDDCKSFARLNEPPAHVVPRGQDKALNWVIVGGESGPGAKPCDIAWIRSIVQQCQAAGTKVFVKQLGSRPVCSEVVFDTDRGIDGQRVIHALDYIKHKKGGDMSEWPADLRVRELPG